MKDGGYSTDHFAADSENWMKRNGESDREIYNVAGMTWDCKGLGQGSAYLSAIVVKG